MKIMIPNPPVLLMMSTAICILQFAISLLPLFRPHHALVLFRDRGHPFEHELLHALTAIGLGRVDVALRVGRDAVHAVELARLPAPLAEAREELERIAEDHMDPVVLAVSEIDVFL